jgi:GTP-binding protein Era
MKKHDIYIDWELSGSNPYKPLLTRVITAALEAEGVDLPCSVDVLLTGDEGIREINREQREVDAVTDVLSFPMLELTPGTPPDGTGEDELDPETGLCCLGDMVLSVERAKEQAEAFGHSVQREIAYLAVHSVLHLLGYDHLDEGPQKARMRAREEAILEGLGITRDHWNEALEQPLEPETPAEEPVRRCGMITLCGRPNVGKSTLTNALVGEKIAIVSNKPQTTRNRICGILTRGDSQFVFLDTPGLHRSSNRLGDYMVDVVKKSVADVDAVLLLVEPIPNAGGPERELIQQIQRLGAPSVLVINKIDTVEKPELLKVIDAYQKVHDFTAIVPISAKRRDGLEELLDLVSGFLPEGPQLFPRDAVTDQPERQLCAEILREKLLYCLDKEVPHGTAVELTRFSERENGILDLEATIYCEKSTHKGIIIGKQGSMLKKISTMAREDMERLLGAKVYLETWVKVKEQWRDNLNLIRSLGFDSRD